MLFNFTLGKNVMMTKASVHDEGSVMRRRLSSAASHKDVQSEANVADLLGLGRAPSTSSVADIGEAPLLAPVLEGACSSPAAEAGRNMLVQFALDAVIAAEDPDSNLTRREVARNYHSAQVYLDVVKAYSGLPADLDEMLRYCRWRMMRCGHLLQNIVHEYVDSDVTLEDHYIVDLQGDGTSIELGTGTYGRVMKVKHRGTGKFYAVKAINVTRLEPKQVSKLYAEISIMREMDHPHVVRLREVFYTKLQIYIVMDLCTGGELFNLVTENPGECATESEIAKAVNRMMGAIHYLHKHRIVHRDLKLENWLLESPGDLSSIKLIDFGLSKHFADEEHLHQAVGSTYYVAPEVLLGNYTEKCDLWSMGVITYMMLSGSPPFWGNNDQQIRNRIIRGQYSTSDKVFKNVSKGGKDFIAMLLKLDPSSRPDAGKALRHSWLTKNASSEAHAVKGSLMPKSDLCVGLKKYSQFTKFRRTVLNVVARNMPPAELKVLRNTFQSIDVDNSGSLTIDDLYKALRGHLSESEIQDMWKNLSVAGMDELDYNEFIAATMWMRLQLDEERLHEAFEAFDDEGKGFLTVEDVERVVGGDLPHEEIQKMMMETDIDGDGKIDYIDFARISKVGFAARVFVFRCLCIDLYLFCTFWIDNTYRYVRAYMPTRSSSN